MPRAQTERMYQWQGNLMRTVNGWAYANPDGIGNRVLKRFKNIKGRSGLFTRKEIYAEIPLLDQSRLLVFHSGASVIVRPEVKFI